MAFEFFFQFLAALPEIALGLWTQYGLVGLLIAGFLENATLFIGIPFEVVIVLANQTSSYSPIVIAIVGGFGAAIGEFLSYLGGYGSRAVVNKLREKDAKRLDDFSEHITKHGALGIYVMSIIPIPFDLVGLASGLLRFDPVQFFLATWAGKSTRYAIIGLAVVYGVSVILPFFGLK